MNPMHQLTRRPVKAAFGALLLALAGDNSGPVRGPVLGGSPDPGRGGGDLHHRGGGYRTDLLG